MGLRWIRALLVLVVCVVASSSLHAQRSGWHLDPVGQPPSAVPAGSFWGIPPQFRVTTSSGAAVANAVVRAGLVNGDGQMSGPTAITDTNGYASFDTIVVYSTPGSHVLRFSIQSASLEDTVNVVLGPPAHIEVVTQPSQHAVSDSLFAVQPIVRVTDNAGNPLEHVDVTAVICTVGSGQVFDSLSTFAAVSGDSACSAFSVGSALLGTTVVRTEESGLATFRDLGLSGRRGAYRIAFHVRGPGVQPTVGTTVIFNDPTVVYDRSYVTISAIKTVAGTAPSDEFFDVRFRFKLGPRWSTLADFDVALTNRGTDTVTSKQTALSEASAALGWAVAPPTTDPVTSVPDRELFVGPLVRVFNSLPYYGVQFGGLELGGSAFQGSSAAVALVHRINNATYFVNGDSLTATPYSIIADAFIRSSKIDFFKALTIRAGVLLPIESNGRLTSRITIAVPIGTIDNF